MAVNSKRLQLLIILSALVLLNFFIGDIEHVKIYEKIDRAGGVQSGGADDLGIHLGREIDSAFD
jgi:hypothetical protein